ncbi:MAG: hypothetical protein OdinLCB4_006265 [Candidatus Odinarchaeum yellowstonii]|uniref:Uncharacterized protein n=1 Tax=Odinarchaeota yellowstonii (strain LCB_4) TaxID=1841599 RepID=A0AAF0D1S3_ODILC|nr:MAG: hypothetical protein OdinLCB4_006265 [Candidatus Odinarchaeum yellowstonii]
MGGKEPLISFENLLSDLLRGVSDLQKMIEEFNRNLISSQEAKMESIINRLDQLESYFHSMKESTELLNELLAELRVLVPTLHLNKLIEEVKSSLTQGKREAPALASKPREAAAFPPTTPLSVKQSQPSLEPASSFRPQPTLESNVEATVGEKKEPDVVYSSKVPSYIKEKRKPKSIWEGLREEDETSQ